MSGEGVLSGNAEAHGFGSRQVALAWLLHHADNLLFCPRHPTVALVEENIAGWPSS